jgi:uncharacterized protein (TIGR00369 family)
MYIFKIRHQHSLRDSQLGEGTKKVGPRPPRTRRSARRRGSGRHHQGRASPCRPRRPDRRRCRGRGGADAAPPRPRLRKPETEWHYNALGTVHGGVLATLADNALGAAVYTRLPAGTGYTTQGLTITFLRPVTVDTGRIRCEATAVHVGRRSAYATATVTDLTGRLLAHATTTCLIFRADGRQPARTREQAAQGTSPTA